jgi:hypothetical protein
MTPSVSLHDCKTRWLSFDAWNPSLQYLIGIVTLQECFQNWTDGHLFVGAVGQMGASFKFLRRHRPLQSIGMTVILCHMIHHSRLGSGNPEYASAGSLFGLTSCERTSYIGEANTK